MISKNLRLLLALMTVALAGAAVYLYVQFPEPKITSVVPAASKNTHVLASEGYAGAESCRECHQSDFSVWEGSAHAHAMAIASPKTVQGDFTRDTTHTFDGQSYRMFMRGDSYFIEAPNSEGIAEIFDVHYILGARQHENYLTRFADGRMQMLPVYYDLNQKQWFDSAEGTLELGKALGVGDYYYWTNHGRTWNKRCFDCHASQMRKNYDLATDTYDTVVGDLSINCEACHGPGAAHIQFWHDAGEDPNLAMKGDDSLPDLSALSAKQQVENCAQCHALKAVLRSGYTPGADYQDYYEPFLINSSEFFWPDGLSKKLAYPYLQFASSGCFLKAGLTCTGCHATHGSERTAELVADPGGVGLCARCHPEVAADVNAHTHHKPTGPGGNCNMCHLPKQFRNQLDMTDHRITVPVPENTVKLDIPNACNQSGCHADQSAEWASDWSRIWYGEYQTKRVDIANAIHRGREGDVSAVPTLLALVQADETAPLLRAGLVEILGKLGDRRAMPQLIEALTDSHSSVRAQASAALGRVGHPLATRPLVNALSDSVFSVRTRAAYALALLDYMPSEAHRDQYQSALGEFESVVNGKGMMADDAHMHLNVGQIYEFRKTFDDALKHYRYALRFLPGLVEAQNRTQRLLEGEARYKKLGLAYVHRGNTVEGIALLDRAASAGVRSDIVETGLGDAHRWLGQFDQAKQHYQSALQLSNGSPGAHRGMALILYAQGKDEKGLSHWSVFEKAQGDGEARVRELMGDK
ncbi:MAG: hypothetical protein HOE48_09780 [Candidatus Latescibacteria bacterium]|nr:hypothetical protein [Candidatus Latescibacterota bacterium]